MSSILIKNCDTLFQGADKPVLKNCDLFIENNTICEIGVDLKVKADRVIPGEKRVVLPGFVNTHHHFYQTFTRNLPAVQNAELFRMAGLSV